MKKLIFYFSKNDPHSSKRAFIALYFDRPAYIYYIRYKYMYSDEVIFKSYDSRDSAYLAFNRMLNFLMS